MIDDKRTLEELKLIAKPCLQYPELVAIARVASSPNAAYDLALRETGNQAKAKLCRWLNMIKRDYGKEVLEKFVREMT